ncbi:MAG: hypothetical protein ACI4SG_01970 [Oligosphaeraceae bacterium]
MNPVPQAEQPAGEEPREKEENHDKKEEPTGAGDINPAEKSGIPKKEGSVPGEELKEFPEKPYSTPTLAVLLHILAYLILIGGGMVFLASLAVFVTAGNGFFVGIAIGALIASIILAMIISGFEQLIVYVAEMHFHTMRQTNLMIKMVKRMTPPSK